MALRKRPAAAPWVVRTAELVMARSCALPAVPVIPRQSDNPSKSGREGPKSKQWKRICVQM